jgi:hypothetical protein
LSSSIRITRLLLILAFLGFRTTSIVHAQRPEGPQTLLLPLTAEGLALGSALALWQGATLALAANPASPARFVGRGWNLSGGSVVQSTMLSASGSYGSRRAGVVSGGLSFFDLATFPATDSLGFEVGTVFIRDVGASLGYAAAIGRVNVGVATRLVQQRADCSGPCPRGNTLQPMVQPFDLGAQALLGRDSAVVLAATVRNLGFGFQVQDAEQRDPLPARIGGGVRWAPRRLPPSWGAVRFSVASEVNYATALREWSGTVAGELIATPELSLLGSVARGRGVLQGAHFGLVLTRGRARLSIARQIAGQASDLGVPPTYVTGGFGF